MPDVSRCRRRCGAACRSGRIHLAPHRKGDALNEQMIRGEIIEEKLPNGMTRFESKEFPPLPVEELREIAERIKAQLAAP